MNKAAVALAVGAMLGLAEGQRAMQCPLPESFVAPLPPQYEGVYEGASSTYWLNGSTVWIERPPIANSPLEVLCVRSVSWPPVLVTPTNGQAPYLALTALVDNDPAVGPAGPFTGGCIVIALEPGTQALQKLFQVGTPEQCSSLADAYVVQEEQTITQPFVAPQACEAPADGPVTPLFCGSAVNGSFASINEGGDPSSAIASSGFNYTIADDGSALWVSRRYPMPWIGPDASVVQLQALCVSNSVVISGLDPSPPQPDHPLIQAVVKLTSLSYTPGSPTPHLSSICALLVRNTVDASNGAEVSAFQVPFSDENPQIPGSEGTSVCPTGGLEDGIQLVPSTFLPPVSLYLSPVPPFVLPSPSTATTVSPSADPTASPTMDPSGSSTATATVSEGSSASYTPTESGTASHTPSSSTTQTNSNTASWTGTGSLSASETGTAGATVSSSVAASFSGTSTASGSISYSSTASASISYSSTASSTATSSRSADSSASSSATVDPSASATGSTSPSSSSSVSPFPSSGLPTTSDPGVLLVFPMRLDNLSFPLFVQPRGARFQSTLSQDLTGFLTSDSARPSTSTGMLEDSVRATVNWTASGPAMPEPALPASNLVLAVLFPFTAADVSLLASLKKTSSAAFVLANTTGGVVASRCLAFLRANVNPGRLLFESRSLAAVPLTSAFPSFTSYLSQATGISASSPAFPHLSVSLASASLAPSTTPPSSPRGDGEGGSAGLTGGQVTGIVIGAFAAGLVGLGVMVAWYLRASGVSISVLSSFRGNKYSTTKLRASSGVSKPAVLIRKGSVRGAAFTLLGDSGSSPSAAARIPASPRSTANPVAVTNLLTAARASSAAANNVLPSPRVAANPLASPAVSGSSRLMLREASGNVSTCAVRTTMMLSPGSTRALTDFEEDDEGAASDTGSNGNRSRTPSTASAHHAMTIEDAFADSKNGSAGGKRKSMAPVKALSKTSSSCF